MFHQRTLFVSAAFVCSLLALGVFFSSGTNPESNVLRDVMMVGVIAGVVGLMFFGNTLVQASVRLLAPYQGIAAVSGLVLVAMLLHQANGAGVTDSTSPNFVTHANRRNFAFSSLLITVLVTAAVTKSTADLSTSADRDPRRLSDQFTASAALGTTIVLMAGFGACASSVAIIVDLTSDRATLTSWFWGAYAGLYAFTAFTLLMFTIMFLYAINNGPPAQGASRPGGVAQMIDWFMVRLNFNPWDVNNNGGSNKFSFVMACLVTLAWLPLLGLFLQALHWGQDADVIITPAPINGTAVIDPEPEKLKSGLHTTAWVTNAVAYVMVLYISVAIIKTYRLSARYRRLALASTGSALGGGFLWLCLALIGLAGYEDYDVLGGAAGLACGLLFLAYYTTPLSDWFLKMLQKLPGTTPKGVDNNAARGQILSAGSRDADTFWGSMYHSACTLVLTFVALAHFISPEIVGIRTNAYMVWVPYILGPGLFIIDLIMRLFYYGIGSDRVFSDAKSPFTIVNHALAMYATAASTNEPLASRFAVYAWALTGVAYIALSFLYYHITHSRGGHWANPLRQNKHHFFVAAICAATILVAGWVYVDEHVNTPAGEDDNFGRRTRYVHDDVDDYGALWLFLLGGMALYQIYLDIGTRFKWFSDREGFGTQGIGDTSHERYTGLFSAARFAFLTGALVAATTTMLRGGFEIPLDTWIYSVGIALMSVSTYVLFSGEMYDGEASHTGRDGGPASGAPMGAGSAGYTAVSADELDTRKDDDDDDGATVVVASMGRGRRDD